MLSVWHHLCVRAVIPHETAQRLVSLFEFMRHL